MLPALLKSLGMENDVDVDDVSDVNFDESDNDHMVSPRAPGAKDSEQITPRQGILKNWTVSTICILSTGTEMPEQTV